MTRAEYEKKMEAEKRSLSQDNKVSFTEESVKEAIEAGEMLLKSIFPDYLMGDQGF